MIEYNEFLNKKIPRFQKKDKGVTMTNLKMII